MKYVVHKKDSSLTPAAQAIRDAFSIKLTRAKERHAEAMGFNSFNHLSETVKQKSVKCHYDEYIERLGCSLNKNHKIEATYEQEKEIENKLDIERVKEADEYFICHSRTSISQEEYDLLVSSEIQKDVNIIFIEDDSFECGYIEEYKSLINGEPTIFVCLKSLDHGYQYTNGIFFLVTKEPIEYFNISPYFMFDAHSVECLPVTLNEDEECEEVMDIYGFIECLEDTIKIDEQKLLASIKKNDGILFPTIFKENYSFFSAIEAIQNNINSHEISDYDTINGHIFSSTVVIKQESTYLELKSLNFIYEELFDSEFLEAYSKFYKILINEFKDIREKLYVEFYDYAEDHAGAPDHYVYFSNIRDFKDYDGSIDVIEDNDNQITFKTLKELFELNGVASINAHSAIKHNCGGDMIMGCSAFDKNGRSVMKFQIFIACDNHFYSTFLNKLKKETGIEEFKVSKNLEYNLNAPIVEVEDEDQVYTFSHPLGNKTPLQLAFLLYKFEDFVDISNGTSVELASNENVIPYIEDKILRDGVIGKPLHLPTNQKEWYPRTFALIEKLKELDSFSIENLHEMMVDEFKNEVENSELVIMASPVIFNLAEDDFSEILLRYGACNEFPPSFKKVDELSKAINVDIQDYMLTVSNPDYKHY